MTEHRVLMAVLLAGLVIVILVSHLFFAGFLNQWTNKSQADSRNFEEQGIQGQENSTRPAEAYNIHEIEEDHEAKGDIEAHEPQEVSKSEVEPVSTPVPATNTPGWGISTNRADLGIYSDSACTQTATLMDVGTVSPGGSVTRTVYVKNMGNNNLTLSLRTTNWNPTTANGLVTLTWNLEGAILAVNQVLAATLTLGVSSNIQGITTFSFDVVISGTE